MPVVILQEVGREFRDTESNLTNKITKSVQCPFGDVTPAILLRPCTPSHQPVCSGNVRPFGHRDGRYPVLPVKSYPRVVLQMACAGQTASPSNY